MEAKSRLIEILALTACAIILVGYIGYNYTPVGAKVVVYDCRIAEISPDIPIAVKEECRKQKYNK